MRKHADGFHRSADRAACKAVYADDIITATTSWANDERLEHPRDDNFVDFAHGEVLIQAGQNQYEAETVVGITKEGEYVFYDVVEMKPTSFKVKEEPSTAATGKDAESAIQESSSAGSITDAGENSKRKFSSNEIGSPADVNGTDLPEMANAEVNTVGAVTNNSQSLGGSAPPISSASGNSITDAGENVNGTDLLIIPYQERSGNYNIRPIRTPASIPRRERSTTAVFLQYLPPRSTNQNSLFCPPGRLACPA